MAMPPGPYPGSTAIEATTPSGNGVAGAVGSAETVGLGRLVTPGDADEAAPWLVLQPARASAQSVRNAAARTFAFIPRSPRSAAHGRRAIRGCRSRGIAGGTTG